MKNHESSMISVLVSGCFGGDDPEEPLFLDRTQVPSRMNGLFFSLIQTGWCIASSPQHFGAVLEFMRSGPGAFGNLFHRAEGAGLMRELRYYSLWSTQHRIVSCVDFHVFTGLRSGAQRVDDEMFSFCFIFSTSLL